MRACGTVNLMDHANKSRGVDTVRLQVIKNLLTPINSTLTFIWHTSFFKMEIIMEQIIQLPEESTWKALTNKGGFSKGGLSDVFICELDGRKVFLKKPIPDEIINQDKAQESRKQLSNEIKILKSIKHENIQKLIGTAETASGQMVAVLEYYGTLDLIGLLRRSLNYKHKLDLSLAALSIVDTLHNMGFIHRDIKIENFMVKILPDNSFSLILIDFGMTERAENDIIPLTFTTKKVCGTPPYVAPEIVTIIRQREMTTISSSIDIYACAFVILFILTQSTEVFTNIKEENENSALFHDRKRPDNLEERIPSELYFLIKILNNLWAHEPSIRYTADQALTIILEEIHNSKINEEVIRKFQDKYKKKSESITSEARH